MKALRVLLALLPLAFGIAHAQVKISALPAASTQVGSEVLPEYQAGQCLSTNGTCGVTTTQLKNYVIGSLSLGSFATQNYNTPPPIGATTPAAGSFTTLSSTGAAALNSATVGSPTGGALGAGTLNAQGVYVQGVPAVSYPQTPAELSVSVTPVNELYPAGNALRYGCAGNNSTLNDICITNALAAAVATGGTRFLYFPSGVYKHANTISVPNGITIYGDGMWGSNYSGSPLGSALVYTGTGDQMASLNPVNSSTAANIFVHDLTLESVTQTTGKANYDDVGSTFLYFSRVMFTGANINLILDQSEIVRVENCLFQNIIGKGVWLVNGAEHTPGASAGYTNEILFKGNQFNGPQTSGIVQVADDGGNSHKFIANNFNYGGTQIRANAVSGLIVIGNEMELPATNIIDFETTKVGGGSGAISENADISDDFFAMGTTQSAINVAATAVQSLTAANDVSNSSGGQPVTNAGGAASHTLHDDIAIVGPSWPATSTVLIQNNGGYQALNSSGVAGSIITKTSSNNTQVIDSDANSNIQLTASGLNDCVQEITSSSPTPDMQDCAGNITIHAPPSGTALAVNGATTLGAPTGGSEGPGTLNAQGVYVQGVPVPSYPQTAAEIAAGVTPTNYLYPPGNVLRYGADPSAVSDSSSAVNSDIKAALASGGTGYIYVPGGTFLISGAQILFGNSLAIVGFNRAASVFWCNLPLGTSCFRYSNNGTSSPVVNTSGYGQVTVSGITITTSPGFSATGSTAAALELSCEGYSYMEVREVRLTGAFKYGLINDGCEVSHYDGDIIDNSGPANSINFWIVNGPDRVSGQSQGFSNLVTIENDQLNGGTYGLVDDGGSNHSIRDTNINGNGTPMRIAGAQAFGIDRDDMENAGIQTGIANIDFESTTLAGAAAGESVGGTIEGNCFCADMAATGSGGKASLAFEGTGYSTGISISGNNFRFNLGPNSDIDVTHLGNSRVGPDNADGNGSSSHYIGIHQDANANILYPAQNGYPGFNPLIVQLGHMAQLAPYTVATLPTCNTTLKGGMAYVTDATAPTYNGALTGGGTVNVPVFCNGSAWTAH